jgi:hypothetical protein
MIRIFLSYAHEDTDSAARIYHELNLYPGVDVWFDQKSLKPGQRWERAIRKAIRDSRYFLVLLSRNSVTKKGFYQKEIRIALEVLDEYPDDETFVVPVRLDDCLMHFDKMAVLQYVDMFPDWNDGIDRIISALRLHERDGQGVASPIRLTSHQAHFRSGARMLYFINIANRTPLPVEITHVWYEDHQCHIQVQPWSRRVPVRLEAHQAWCTWLGRDEIPEAHRDDAYDRFRLRLSTGEVIASNKEDSVPPVGPVPGGPIDERDL